MDPWWWFKSIDEDDGYSGDKGEIRSSSRYGGEYGVGTTSRYFRDRSKFDGNMFPEPRRDRSEPRALSKGKGKKHTSVGSSFGRRSSSSNLRYSDSSTSTQNTKQGQDASNSGKCSTLYLSKQDRGLLHRSSPTNFKVWRRIGVRSPLCDIYVKGFLLGRISTFRVLCLAFLRSVKALLKSKDGASDLHSHNAGIGVIVRVAGAEYAVNHKYDRVILEIDSLV
ncbi:hypothetical protein GOBAR_AA11668 [Gossypium barbadense]|uniref:Uncharacterized protein n=1 Tax=Gossypium barbadense TaxID=3634 RepID=A0A2P5Y062_GOSBA|nr:hypothetical protein GOBAR_AA11668 [Gossypium barbadense]